MAYESVFTIDDYVLFGIVICIYLFSSYHFSRATGQTQNDENFMFASRSFNWKLICMSLASSMVPGLSILNITAQLYFNGPVVGLILVAYLIGILTTALVFIPLFSRLNTSTIFTYLKLRFSRFIQVLAAIVFCIYMVIFCILNAYVSVSALSEATGFPSQTVVLIGSVTTLYTTLGGLRAVVWTQAYQYVLVCIGLMGFVIKGLIQRRSDIFTPFKLFGDSISSPVPLWYWTVTYMIGATFQVVSVVTVNQSYIQRALAIQPQKRKRVFLCSLVPLSVIFLLLLMSALIIHVTSYDCSYLYPDMPFLQVLPYTVAHGLNDHPGMSGFFLAVVFSASMSFTSSTLHSVATIVGEDFIKSTFGELRDSMYLLLLKGFVICTGVMVIFVPLLLNGSQAQQLAISITGMLGGPLLGLFTLGICFSGVDSVAAFIAFIISIIFNIWSYIHGTNLGLNTLPHLEPSFSCYVNGTTMMTHQEVADHTSELHLWNGLFSYQWYAFSGFVVVIVIGIAIGLIRGCPRHENPELLLIKSSLMSLDCIRVGAKTFMKRKSGRKYNDDVHNHEDYYDANDDKQREFYELELYHRSPYHRSTNERSRWLTEGNKFYEPKSKHTSDQLEADMARVCEDISEQRCRLIGQSSSRASSTDSAYATVRGFDFRRIQEFQNYEEEPFNRSIQNSVECIEEIPSKSQTVGRFSVTMVHVEKVLEKKTPENEDVSESPSSQRAGTLVDLEEPSNTLKVTLSTPFVCSSNNKTDNDQNDIEKRLSNIDDCENVDFNGQTKKPFKTDRFLVSKCNSSECLSQVADPQKSPSDVAVEICGDSYTMNLPSGGNSTTNMEDRLVDSSKQRQLLVVKGNELSNASNPMHSSLSAVNRYPNRTSLHTASDIGEFDNSFHKNDADILNRDLIYLETEL